MHSLSRPSILYSDLHILASTYRCLFLYTITKTFGKGKETRRTGCVCVCARLIFHVQILIFKMYF